MGAGGVNMLNGVDTFGRGHSSKLGRHDASQPSFAHCVNVCSNRWRLLSFHVNIMTITVSSGDRMCHFTGEIMK